MNKKELYNENSILKKSNNNYNKNTPQLKI